MYRAQSDKVQNQQLKVQEVTVRTADTQLYVVDGADVVVLIGEPLTAAVSALFEDDSAGTITPVAAAARVIVDMDSPYAPGGDASAIRLVGVTLAANDVLHIKYITLN